MHYYYEGLYLYQLPSSCGVFKIWEAYIWSVTLWIECETTNCIIYCCLFCIQSQVDSNAAFRLACRLLLC